MAVQNTGTLTSATLLCTLKGKAHSNIAWEKMHLTVQETHDFLLVYLGVFYIL